ncbi:MAG: prepilin-type N-terminal cleavage/methylation domain-containing protein [Bacilli bacterium]|nr:prepilin-type N-terminal cleavage/methylation domain-containing protein [Bacilli bacterium]
MKNKGFTLIELLAVIVVLAVVALIAFPIIAGIIEKTKRSAAYRSVEGYVEAANNAAVLYDLDNSKGINVTESKHTFISSSDTDAFSKIKAKGTLPTYSYLDFDINKKVVTEGHFCINGYSVLYSEGTAKASETKYCEEDNTGGNGSGSNSGGNNQGNNSEGFLSNMRWDKETKYIQVYDGVSWINYDYFNPSWNGVIYFEGAYDTNYFDEFSGEGYSFQPSQLRFALDTTTTKSSAIFNVAKVADNMTGISGKELHILFDCKWYGGTGPQYNWYGGTVDTHFNITLKSEDGIVSSTTSSVDKTVTRAANTNSYTYQGQQLNIQKDIALTQFDSKGPGQLIFKIWADNYNIISDTRGVRLEILIKKIWIS